MPSLGNQTARGMSPGKKAALIALLLAVILLGLFLGAFFSSRYRNKTYSALFVCNETAVLHQAA